MASQEIDVINFVMNQGNGVKALSDLSLGTVPANYILPVEQRLGELNTKSKTDSDRVIPIIDVSNWEDSPIIEGLICDAARKLGFFQIINHGIPMEVFDKVLEASHRFFALPVEERKEYFFRSNDSGDTCHLKTSFMSHKEKVLEWKDFLLHQICSSQNSKEVKEGKDLPKGFSRWPPISRYLLKSSIISALSKQALKPNGASDLSALQQLLVDQPNIPKEEVQFLFDIIFAEEIC